MSAQRKQDYTFNVGDEVAVIQIATGRLQHVATVSQLWHTGAVMFGPTGLRFHQDGTEVVYPKRVHDDAFDSLTDSDGYSGKQAHGHHPYREIPVTPTLMIRHATDADRAEIQRRRARAERIERIRAFATALPGVYDQRPGLNSLTDDQIDRIAAILDEPRPEDGGERSVD